jgi:signal transduction histidine kinase
MVRWAVASLRLLVLLVASLLLLLSVRDASRRVQHTDEVQVALLKLESLVIDAEAGARGYAVSGSEPLLEPYTRALAIEPGAFEAVRALTRDNGAQQMRLDALEPLIDRQQGVLQSTIDARAAGATAERMASLVNLGEEVMVNIESRIGDLIDEEERLDEERLRSESTRIGMALGAIGAALALILAGTAWFVKVRRLERRVLERERDAREEAERASKFAELFVAVLGHDLRNPLGAITTSGALLDREARDERAQRLTTRILGSSKRMERMIDQILDFSRIRAGRALIQKPTSMDLREVIGRVRDELARGSSIQVEAEGTTDGVWDRDRLSQVFSNLLGNALEHSPEGATVHVNLDGRASDRIEVTVQNPGAIPADVMPEVFEPFRQARQQRTTGGGLGLGLYITKEIVTAHGGTIDVTSSESAGTRFQVRLPRVAPANGPSGG